MMTSTILLLLVAAASTFAFSPPAYPSLVARRRRDIPTGSKAGSGTGAVAFSGSSSSSSSSGAGNGFATSISSRSGGFPSDEVGPNSVSAGGYNSVNPGAYGSNDFNFPNPAYNNQYGGGYPDFNRFFQEYMAFMQRLAQQAAYAPNEIYTRGAFGPDQYGTPQNGFYFPGPSNYGGNYGGSFGGNPGNGNSASASASLTPRGGFGSVSISPPPQGDPGLGTRMGSVPSSGGDGNFAVFSSSSSGSSDVNGERKSYKEATSVINDNGKVTTFHVSDP